MPYRGNVPTLTLPCPPGKGNDEGDTMTALGNAEARHLVDVKGRQLDAIRDLAETGLSNGTSVHPDDLIDVLDGPGEDA